MDALRWAIAISFLAGLAGCAGDQGARAARLAPDAAAEPPDVAADTASLDRARPDGVPAADGPPAADARASADIAPGVDAAPRADGRPAADAGPGNDAAAAPASRHGPRHPVGCDVPLGPEEAARLARRVTVAGRTAAAVQAALDQAARERIPVVFLPAGEYLFERVVSVPGQITVLGEGCRTLVKAPADSSRLFTVAGDRVRFSRLRIEGARTTWSTTNASAGISISRRKDVRIDHCDVSGFRHGLTFADEATGQVDHCYVHHNLVAGYGYGLVIVSGAYVLITDSHLGESRHSLTSNGALDWRSGEMGLYRKVPGVRKTHWELRHSRVAGDTLDQQRQAEIDTHPGMDGTFVITRTVFEQLPRAVIIVDGSGLIHDNVFRDFSGPVSGQVGIQIQYGTHNGIPVEGAMPHDIQIGGNVFTNVGQPYRIGRAVNIVIDGRVVPATADPNAPPPPPIPLLHEMGDDGALRWEPSRPR